MKNYKLILFNHGDKENQINACAGAETGVVQEFETKPTSLEAGNVICNECGKSVIVLLVEEL